MTSETSDRRGVLHSGAGPLLWSLLFLVVFMATFFLQTKSTLMVENVVMQGIITKYSVLVGPALALLAMLAMYLIAGIKRIVGLRKFKILNPIVVLAVIAPLLIFGYQLQYRENRYTDFARAIIGLYALPLLVAGGAICTLALIWLIVTILRRAKS